MVLEPQSVTTVAEKLWNVELQLCRAIGDFRYSVGVGADYGGPVTDPTTRSSVAGSSVSVTHGDPGPGKTSLHVMHAPSA